MPSEPTRQLTFTVPGSHPHWTYGSVELPIGRSQLLIRIEACSFGSVDLAILNTTSLWGSVGEKGLGRDFSGVVVEVGNSLKGKWSQGDEVCGMYFHPVSFPFILFILLSLYLFAKRSSIMLAQSRRILSSTQLQTTSSNDQIFFPYTKLLRSHSASRSHTNPCSTTNSRNHPVSAFSAVQQRLECLRSS